MCVCVVLPVGPRLTLAHSLLALSPQNSLQPVMIASLVNDVAKSINDAIAQIRDLLRKPRKLVWQAVGLLTVIGFTLMAWQCVRVYTSCDGPVVVVLSGSMEPAIFRGDILTLDNSTTSFNTGDIVVCESSCHLK